MRNKTTPHLTSEKISELLSRYLILLAIFMTAGLLNVNALGARGFPVPWYAGGSSVDLRSFAASLIATLAVIAAADILAVTIKRVKEPQVITAENSNPYRTILDVKVNEAASVSADPGYSAGLDSTIESYDSFANYGNSGSYRKSDSFGDAGSLSSFGSIVSRGRSVMTSALSGIVDFPGSSGEADYSEKSSYSEHSEYDETSVSEGQYDADEEKSYVNLDNFKNIKSLLGDRKATESGDENSGKSKAVTAIFLVIFLLVSMAATMCGSSSDDDWAYDDEYDEWTDEDEYNADYTEFFEEMAGSYEGSDENTRYSCTLSENGYLDITDTDWDYTAVSGQLIPDDEEDMYYLDADDFDELFLDLGDERNMQITHTGQTLIIANPADSEKSIVFTEE